MDATVWAFVALLIMIGIFIYFGVPGRVAMGLDKRAERIRAELDEARQMRDEAQALLAEYQRRRREAEAEAEEIVAQAKAEAERLTAETNRALEEMIERRTRAAEAKIAQAEAQAVAEVRSIAVDVALAAAGRVLAEQAAGAAGTGLLDAAIADVKAKLN